jgi:5-methylthioadenosine/S-adenosylhomocysteine deaminase
VSSKFLIRGGCVLTLGTKTSNFAEADLLIEDGRVAEVGPGLRARDAEQVDAADAIVMPGFVDTHRHAWKSLFRNLGGSAEGSSAAVVGDRFGPDDVYAATLIGLLGAIEAGITTVVDWSDVGPDEASAEAALQAHADAGLRTVFVHLPRLRGDANGTTTRQLVARLTEAAGPSTTLAFGSGAPAPGDLDRVAGEWALARDLDLPVHLHATSGGGVISAMAERGVLGADVRLIHCFDLDDADLDAIAAAGASVSLAPSSEMASGLGAPPIQPLTDRGIRPGLGVDDELIAPGDLFAQMRAMISWQHAIVFDRKLMGKAGLPRLMTTRDAIRSATVEGARVAGTRAVAGSLDPGMQADVIVLRTDRPNIFPINDPIGAVVWGMDTSNVDWVFAGGRALMREGVLQTDMQHVRTIATEARERVAGSAGLVVGAAPGGEG